MIVSHLETAHDVWLKFCNIYEGSSEIKSSHKNTYNRQYQTFAQKPGGSLGDCFVRFQSIVSNLRSCGPLAYSDNERDKKLLYALNDHVWGMKITALEESADFATLDDVDINTSDTSTPTHNQISGPITRAHARQLNNQVSSFLASYSSYIDNGNVCSVLFLRIDGQERNGVAFAPVTLGFQNSSSL
jgi:hypothetical protein